MSALIPPLAGVLIASYWIVGGGKKENFAIRSGFSAVGLISFAVGAVQECGPVTLIDPDEVPDDALIVPIAMMGAPTVLGEKAIGGTEYKKLFDMVSKFFGRKIYALSLYSMSGKQMKEFGVRGIVTRSERLGRAIRTIKDCGDRTPEEHFLAMSEGFKLFKGKIADVLRETRSGFNFGKVVLEGIGDYKGQSAHVEKVEIKIRRGLPDVA